ncbi:unnamed protein product [Spirodela intermedia]|uniref:Protein DETOXIFICATION n=1 Tax=Spirodela intermedia TaxID=51605 RepID=A0A7I8JB27_SPIIN|nr:unnamed protein product [Spirodela intermedia]CAA6667320.1 unnamed protein product [Spirodela intermedia]
MAVEEAPLNDDDDTQIKTVGKDPLGGEDKEPECRTVHRKTGLFIFFKDARNALKLDAMGLEIAGIAVPAALALAADPIASLVDTVFVGQIGPVELAAVGVSIAVFNQISKVAIYPIVSVTTSFVAEEHAALQEKASSAIATAAAAGGMIKKYIQLLCVPYRCRGSQERLRVWAERQFIPSVSSALVVGAVLGLLQALLLGFAAKPFLRLMGVKPGSPMMTRAHRYLSLRSIGAPAVLLSLAMQGFSEVAGDVTNIVLDPIFIFVLRWGVAGAAIAHVISQYLISAILLWRLLTKVQVIPSDVRDLKFSRFLTCGFLLLARVVAVTFCVTLAASLAACRGPIAMAAFQVCLQVWLSTSLIADGLAVAGQFICHGDHQKAVAVASRVLQLGIILGLGLSAVIGIGMKFGSGIFTKDKNVQKLIHTVLPFVAATQPINSLAFVFDGINFGASDYIYSAYSMVLVAILSVISLFMLSSSHGFIGIWISLTIYISLRMFAGIWRMGAAQGPWNFLGHLSISR